MIVRRQLGFGYVVQEGDTVEGIAAAARTTWEVIATANGFPADASFINNTLLTPGKAITVPGEVAGASSAGTGTAGGYLFAGVLATLTIAALLYSRHSP